ncbi:hypothetical protein APY03_6549 [Variovorax sp. WDL1]|nr:hypothetical protein APY03_6549 [Variovorax sp. WDL1]
MALSASATAPSLPVRHCGLHDPQPTGPRCSWRKQRPTGRVCASPARTPMGIATTIARRSSHLAHRLFGRSRNGSHLWCTRTLRQCCSKCPRQPRTRIGRAIPGPALSIARLESRAGLRSAYHPPPGS